MLNLLEEMGDSYEDGIICESESQTEKIWKIREGISMATAHNGFVSLHQESFMIVKPILIDYKV